MEDEANRVSRGESVNGIGLIVPFNDVRAHRAKVTWIGDKQPAPTALAAAHLMYLGRGRDVAAFVSCGERTILVPADQVSIELLYADEVLTPEKEQQQFAALCPARRG